MLNAQQLVQRLITENTARQHNFDICMRAFQQYGADALQRNTGLIYNIEKAIDKTKENSELFQKLFIKIPPPDADDDDWRRTTRLRDATALCAGGSLRRSSSSSSNNSTIAAHSDPNFAILSETPPSEEEFAPALTAVADVRAKSKPIKIGVTSSFTNRLQRTDTALSQSPPEQQPISAVNAAVTGAPNETQEQGGEAQAGVNSTEDADDEAFDESEWAELMELQLETNDDDVAFLGYEQPQSTTEDVVPEATPPPHYDNEFVPRNAKAVRPQWQHMVEHIRHNIKVVIRSATGPLSFYAFPAAYLGDEDDAEPAVIDPEMVDMLKLCGKHCSNVEGEFGIGLYTDGNYYRCRIVASPSWGETQCQVYFLDFGNYATVDIAELVKLPMSSFGEDQPVLAMELALYGVVCASDDINARFVETVKEGNTYWMDLIAPADPRQPSEKWKVILRETDDISQTPLNSRFNSAAPWPEWLSTRTCANEAGAAASSGGESTITDDDRSTLTGEDAA